MGLGNIVNTVLTKYKADTKEHKKAIKGLKGEELKRHKALLSQMEKQNQGIDDQIAFYGKLAGGVAAVGVAAMALKDGFDTLQKNSRLAAATVGVDLKGLEGATRGLVDQTRLLEFASKAMNGTFKLSQGEMEKALQGALALRKTMGVDLTVALDRVQKAITEGTTEPLKELGVVMKDVENDSREGLNAVLEEMGNQARKTGGDFDIVGDDVNRSAVKMENAMDSLKESMGRLAVALAPVVALLAEFSALAAGIFDVESKVHKGIDADAMVKRLLEANADPSLLSKVQAARRTAEVQALLSRGAGGAGGALGALGGLGHFFESGPGQSQQRKRGKGGRRGSIDVGFGPSSLGGAIGDAAGFASSLAERGVGGLQGLNDNEAQRREDAALTAQENYVRGVERAQEANAAFQAMLDEETHNLASIFGTPDEINMQAEAIGVLANSFDIMAGAAGAAFGAFIDGSMSATEAAKKFTADALKALAVDSAVRALRELAFAAAATFTNPAQVAGHLKAAALFSATAVAAGGGARLLGGSGGGATAPRATTGASGVGVSGAGAANGNSGSTQIFILGQDFEGMPAQHRKSVFRESARRAGVTIEGDAVING